MKIKMPLMEQSVSGIYHSLPPLYLLFSIFYLLFLIFPFYSLWLIKLKQVNFYCIFAISPLQILDKYTHPHIFLGKRKDFLQDFYYLCTRMLLLCTIKSVGRD